MRLGLDCRRADRICTATERWLVPLVPIALVSVSGVADVFCSVVAILFIVRAAVRRDGSAFNQSWFIALLLLWIYLCIRSAFAAHAGASLGEAIIWLRYPVFAIAAGKALSNADDRRRFVTITVCSVLFLSADAILQYCIGYDVTAHQQQNDMRLTGPFGRPRVGITIAWMFLPPLLALIERRRWLWAAALGGTSILAIVLSGERTSLATLGLDVICAPDPAAALAAPGPDHGRDLRGATVTGDDRKAVDLPTAGQFDLAGRHSARSIAVRRHLAPWPDDCGRVSDPRSRNARTTASSARTLLSVHWLKRTTTRAVARIRTTTISNG